MQLTHSHSAHALCVEMNIQSSYTFCIMCDIKGWHNRNNHSDSKKF